MKKLGIFMASLLLLGACSNEESAPAETKEPEKAVASEQKELTESGFITQARGKEILVNNIYFTVGENVKVVSDNGKETSDAVISDIRTGMKVDVDYTGPLEQTFPMNAEAETITILKDEESVTQTEALQAYINKEQLANLVIIGQPIVRDNEIGFLFSNTAEGTMSEVRINMDTLEYTVGGE